MTVSCDGREDGNDFALQQNIELKIHNGESSKQIFSDIYPVTINDPQVVLLGQNKIRVMFKEDITCIGNNFAINGYTYGSDYIITNFIGETGVIDILFNEELSSNAISLEVLGLSKQLSIKPPKTKVYMINVYF
jgi:hypothetical protein